MNTKRSAQHMDTPSTLERAVIGLAEAADKFTHGPEAETVRARDNLLAAARHYSVLSRFEEVRNAPDPELDSRKDGTVHVFKKRLTGEIFEFRWDGIRRVWTRDCQPGATWLDVELRAVGFLIPSDVISPVPLTVKDV